MQTLPKSIERLINQFSQLPGVGPKTASRLVFYLIRNNTVDLKELSGAVADLKASLVYCSICHNIAEKDPCNICGDATRDVSVICVVEEPLDVIALERAGFRGMYHVLGGHISPLEGIGPKDLHINNLLKRLDENRQVQEVIITTNPNVEGEATATYLIKLLSGKNIRITRIARGLPMGGDLEYADELTLSRALEGRNEVVL